MKKDRHTWLTYLFFSNNWIKTDHKIKKYSIFGVSPIWLKLSLYWFLQCYFTFSLQNWFEVDEFLNKLVCLLYPLFVFGAPTVNFELFDHRIYCSTKCFSKRFSIFGSCTKCRGAMIKQVSWSKGKFLFIFINKKNFYFSLSWNQSSSRPKC